MAASPASTNTTTTTTLIARAVGLLAMAAAVLGMFPTPASAAEGGAQDRKRVSFGVSAPADLQDAKPGEVVKTWLGVSNQLPTPMTVHVRMITMQPRDDGHFQVVDTPDPAWAGLVTIKDTVVLAPHKGVRLPVTVRMPTNLAPDIYLVGFLAEPEAAPNTPGAIVVRNQVSTFLTLNVPGKRHRSISVPWQHLPRIQFGRTVHASFRVTNSGLGTTVFRGQVRIDTLRGKNVAVLQATGDQPQLLPGHTSRTVSYTWHAGGLFYAGHPHLEIAYPTGEAKMATIEQDAPLVLVIPKETVYIPVVVLFVFLLWRSWVKRGRLAKAATASGTRAAVAR